MAALTRSRTTRLNQSPARTPPDAFSFAWDAIGTRVLAGARSDVLTSWPRHTPESRFNGLAGDFHGCGLRDWTVMFERKAAIATLGPSVNLRHRPRLVVRRASLAEHDRQETLRRFGRRHATSA